MFSVWFSDHFLDRRQVSRRSLQGFVGFATPVKVHEYAADDFAVSKVRFQPRSLRSYEIQQPGDVFVERFEFACLHITSIRLARKISSSHVSSGISPICVRYMRTGSSIRFCVSGVGGAALGGGRSAPSPSQARQRALALAGGQFAQPLPSRRSGRRRAHRAS